MEAQWDPFFRDVAPVLLLTTSDSQSHLPHVLTLRQKSPSGYTEKNSLYRRQGGAHSISESPGFSGKGQRVLKRAGRLIIMALRSTDYYITTK